MSFIREYFCLKWNSNQKKRNFIKIPLQFIPRSIIKYSYIHHHQYKLKSFFFSFSNCVGTKTARTHFPCFPNSFPNPRPRAPRRSSWVRGGSRIVLMAAVPRQQHHEGAMAARVTRSRMLEVQKWWRLLKLTVTFGWVERERERRDELWTRRCGSDGGGGWLGFGEVLES